MDRVGLWRRLAHAAAILALVATVPGSGRASTAYQDASMLWLNYPGGDFLLQLYPTANAAGGPLGYFFGGVVYSQSTSCGPGGFETVNGQGKSVYVADATAGAAGTGTLTGLASGECGSRTFRMSFTYTGRGGFTLIHNPPNARHDYAILQRGLTATGRFCWIGGTGACTSFGSTTNAAAETVVVLTP